MTDTLNDISLAPSLLTEDARPSGKLCEDVEVYELDPDVYIAVVEAELGKAGVVNKNERIYQPEEFIRENMRLAARLSDEFVDGELGHPRGGPTFDVPARLLKVTTESTSPNTATAIGTFGILATQTGRDVLTLYRAGMPIGVSSRGEGMLEEIIIEEDGPYAEMNPDYVGRSVNLVKSFSLDRYDLVRVPSAGTHLYNPGGSNVSTESVEAVIMAKPSKADEMVESKVNTEVDQETASIAPAEAAQAVLESDPLYGLNDAQKGVLLKIVNSITVAEDANESDLVKEIASLREQMMVDRHRTTLNEAEFKRLNEEIASLREERDERQLQDRLATATVDATAEKRFGAIVSEQLSALIAESVIRTVEGVEKHAHRLFAMLESANAPVVAPVEQEAQDVQEDVEVAVEEAAAELPAGLDEDTYNSLKALMVRDRARIGG